MRPQLPPEHRIYRGTHGNMWPVLSVSTLCGLYGQGKQHIVCKSLGKQHETEPGYTYNYMNVVCLSQYHRLMTRHWRQISIDYIEIGFIVCQCVCALLTNIDVMKGNAWISRKRWYDWTKATDDIVYHHIKEVVRNSIECKITMEHPTQLQDKLFTLCYVSAVWPQCCSISIICWRDKLYTPNTSANMEYKAILLKAWSYDIWLVSHMLVWWSTLLRMISTCHVIHGFTKFSPFLRYPVDSHTETSHCSIAFCRRRSGKEAASDDGYVTRVADVTMEWNAVSLCVTGAASTDGQYAAIAEHAGDAHLRHVVTLHLLHPGDSHPGGWQYKWYSRSRSGWEMWLHPSTQRDSQSRYSSQDSHTLRHQYTLASAICLYLSGLHFDRGASSQGISKKRARDIVVVSWFFSFSMMFYPMIVSCTRERIFHLLLYSWLSYVLLALGLAIFFSFASCVRPVCSNYNLMGARSRFQGLFLLLLVILLAVTLLPLPVHELILMFRSNDHYNVTGQQMEESMDLDQARRTSLQCLPFLFYLISPMLLLAASNNTRTEITEPRRSATSKVSFSNSVQVKLVPRESNKQKELPKFASRGARPRSIFGITH